MSNKALFFYFLCLTVIVLAAGGCGGRKGPYTKHISIRPPDQYTSMFMRLERAFRRRDLDTTMDCFARAECKQYGNILTYLTDLYRRGDKMTLKLYKGGARDKPLTRTFEFRWQRAYFDIYDRCWHKAKGTAFFKVNKGEVVRILDVQGGHPFQK